MALWCMKAGFQISARSASGIPKFRPGRACVLWMGVRQTRKKFGQYNHAKHEFYSLSVSSMSKAVKYWLNLTATDQFRAKKPPWKQLIPYCFPSSSTKTGLCKFKHVSWRRGCTHDRRGMVQLAKLWKSFSHFVVIISREKVSNHSIWCFNVMNNRDNHNLTATLPMLCISLSFF